MVTPKINVVYYSDDVALIASPKIIVANDYGWKGM